MKILCGTKTPQVPPASQLVNRFGKYLYKHFMGAYKYKKSGNMYDIYCTLLYELLPEHGGTPNDVQEITININLTTYQNKIRVNTIEVSPEERTLGCDVFKPEALLNLEKARLKIEQTVRTRIETAYKDYKVLY